MATALLAGALLSACGGASDSSPAASDEIGPLRISGGGSAQFREAGEDNSIEGYGQEADRSELEQAAADVHGFLAARVTGDWSEACRYLSDDYRRRLAREARGLEQIRGTGCAAMGNAYSTALPRRERYDASEVNAGSLRVKGDTGFLFFFSGSEGHKFLMVREDGKWWIAANLDPTSLH